MSGIGFFCIVLAVLLACIVFVRVFSVPAPDWVKTGGMLYILLVATGILLTVKSP